MTAEKKMFWVEFRHAAQYAKDMKTEPSMIIIYLKDDEEDKECHKG